MIDYRITYTTGLSETVVENVLTSPFEATSLVTGSNYMFQVEARNEFGYSVQSKSVYIYCAFVPEKVSTLSTAINGGNVVVTWTAPFNNGATITSYMVEIKQSDYTFAQELTYCDASQTAIVQSQTCSIPILTLLDAPFSLELGGSVYARVTATNYYGDSEVSDEANGAVVVVLPDAPINLADDTSVTSASVIGLVWDDGVSDGGTAILDYFIQYDQGTGTWVQLVSGVSTKSYSTIITLTPGTTYQFQVKSRNAVGYSTFSSIVSVLAA